MVCDCVAQLQDALLEQMEEKDAQARRTSHVALDSASTADPTAHAPLSHRTGRPIISIRIGTSAIPTAGIRGSGLGCQVQSAEPSGTVKAAVCIHTARTVPSMVCTAE